MGQKISCGGFYIGEGLELNDNVLSVNGGSGSGSYVAKFTVSEAEGAYTVETEESVADIAEKLQNGVNVIAHFIFDYEEENIQVLNPFYFVFIPSEASMCAFTSAFIAGGTKARMYLLGGFNEGEGDFWQFEEKETESSGSTEPLIVTLEGDDPYTASHSPAEIKAAVEAGQSVWLSADGKNALHAYGDDFAEFLSVYVGNSSVEISLVTIDENKSCTVKGMELTP